MIRTLILALLALQDGHKEEIRPETQKAIQEAAKLAKSGGLEAGVNSLELIYKANRDKKETVHEAAAAIQQIGFIQYQAGNHEKSRLAFKRIADEFPKCGLYGMSKFNIGVILSDNLKKYALAIQEFRELIKSGVNDKDKTGMLMNPYRNYRYNAWRMIGSCSLKMTELTAAVESYLQAQKAYVSHCGTCLRNTASRVTGWLVAAARELGYEPKVKLAEIKSAHEWLISLAKEEKIGITGSRAKTAWILWNLFT